MGEDSTGRSYGSEEEFWLDELGEGDERKHLWYAKAKQYWENSEASISGVLQGFDAVSSTDISGSLLFFDNIYNIHPSTTRRGGFALDCGAGIGRVTKDCLVKLFDHVDIVEPNKLYLDKAKEHINSDKAVGFVFHLNSC
eukprot:GHVQ01036141.1.p1 GENE.GHVQ01036141.1~~GHVQ01036141.1.p1  ORF type:complete len:140 (+),score=25.26 GHVQ01036141.1:569-988(+)